MQLWDPGARATTTLTEPASADLKRRGLGWVLLLTPIAVLLLGLGLRIYRLDGRSLWLDEILTAQTAHLQGPADVVAWSQAAINQMPFFYLFTWAIGHWGDNSVLMRLPAVVAGTLLVLAVYLVTASLFGRWVGLTAGLITALVPYTVWFSQDARNYSLFMLLTTLQMYFAYSAVKRGRIVDWIGLGVFTTLNLYTHYLALLAAAAVTLYVFGAIAGPVLKTTTKRVRIVGAVVALLLGAALIAVPWRPLVRVVYHEAATALPTHWVRQPALLLAGVLAVTALAAYGFVLRGRSMRTKIAATAIAFGAAIAALVVRVATGVGDGGVAILAAAGLVSLVVVWLDVLRRWPTSRSAFVGASITGLAVGAAYAAWLPSLRVFVSRPDQSIGSVKVGHAPTVSDLAAMLGQLDLTGFLLVGLCVGLITLAFWMFSSRLLEAGLILSWILVPLAVFLYSARASIVGIDVRYFSVIYPAWLIAIACGVEGLAVGGAWILRRSHVLASKNQRLVPAVAGVLVVGLMLVQTGSALASSYLQPAVDYRSAAEHIASSSMPPATVIALGNYSDWTVICFDYYFRQLRAPISVVDGLGIDNRTIDRLAGDGTVWGVVIFPSTEQQALLAARPRQPGDFVDVTRVIHVVRSDRPELPALEQAAELLSWELPMEPQLSGPAKLIGLSAGKAMVGNNLVPQLGAGAQPSPGWQLDPPVTSNGDGVALNPDSHTPHVKAALWVSIQPGNDYFVGVEYRAQTPGTSQRMIALALDSTGRALATYPSPSGYECTPSLGWLQGYFALTAPPGSSALELQLQANGSGSAEFRNIRVSPITNAG